MALFWTSSTWPMDRSQGNTGNTGDCRAWPRICQHKVPPVSKGTELSSWNLPETWPPDTNTLPINRWARKQSLRLLTGAIANSHCSFPGLVFQSGLRISSYISTGTTPRGTSSDLHQGKAETQHRRQNSSIQHWAWVSFYQTNQILLADTQDRSEPTRISWQGCAVLIIITNGLTLHCLCVPIKFYHHFGF